jgi:hypothetical protein
MDGIKLLSNNTMVDPAEGITQEPIATLKRRRCECCPSVSTLTLSIYLSDTVVLVCEDKM